MIPRSVRTEAEDLRRQIERHNCLYSVEAAPAVSDREFDRLLRLPDRSIRHRGCDGGRW